jgi:hypothetical protein
MINETLIARISNKYNKVKEELFLKHFNEIIKEGSLKELYNEIESGLEKSNDDYIVTTDYKGNKQLVLLTDECDEDYSYGCLLLKLITNKEDSYYFQKRSNEFNDNTKIIRIIDRLYHHTNYEIIFNEQSDEVIFYNTQSHIMFDDKDVICFKFNKSEILEDEIKTEEKDYLIFILCVIYDFFWTFEFEEELTRLYS